MRRSEIRPCDSCRGPVGTVFNLIRHSLVVVDMDAVRQNEAMRMMFPGAPAVAANFAPDDIATVAGEEDPKTWTDIVLCMNCFGGLRRDGRDVLPIGLLVEARNAEVAAKKEREVE